MPAERIKHQRAKTPLVEDAGKYQPALNTLTSKKADFQRMRNIMRAAFESNHPYSEVFFRPTGVRLYVLRLNLRDPDENEGKEKEVGRVDLRKESPLSVSAGIGFSTIDDVKIVRQSSLVPDGMGHGRRQYIRV